MESVIIGNLDGGHEQVAFDIRDVKKVVNNRNARILPSTDGSGIRLEVDGEVCPVRDPVNANHIKDYFIILKSGVAFNLKDYQLLFGVKRLPNHFLCGVDAGGNPHLCKSVRVEGEQVGGIEEPTIADLDQRLRAVNSSLHELTDLKDIITRVKNGEFFEALAAEVSGKIKEVAQDLIDFRKDIQKRIEPEIVEMAARDIPEASSQLEGINDTLEKSTMKIMDINEEQMALAEGQIKRLESLLLDGEPGRRDSAWIGEVLREHKENLMRIKDLSMRMMEPLSFQDLVGQRIQKIIRLVKTMEVRIEDIIISFGLKIQRHKENPEKSFQDLRKEVEQYKSELKGPQKEGEGLGQAQIDELLASL